MRIMTMYVKNQTRYIADLEALLKSVFGTATPVKDGFAEVCYRGTGAFRVVEIIPTKAGWARIANMREAAR